MGNTDLSCGMKCLKYMLFAVNFIVWICGIAVLVVGIISRVKAGDWQDLIADASVTDAANLLIASGIFVSIIGFVGCCGAVKQNRPFLIIYIVFLILIFILEIGGGIYAYTRKDKVIASLKSGFDRTIRYSYGVDTNTNTANKKMTETVDWFQKNFKCCGAGNSSSWKNTAWYQSVNSTHQRVPKSCCKNVNEVDCNVGTVNKTLNIFSKGCVDAGKVYLKDHILEIGGVGVGIAFVQLIGIIFAILLVRSINENVV